MDVYKLKEEQQIIQKQVDKYEEALKRLGVDLNSLPEDVRNMLDKVIETQLITGIHDIEESFLKEFYLQKSKEKVDNTLSANKMRAEIDSLKKQIQRETAECDLLTKFVSQPVTSEKESRVAASLLEIKIKNLQAKQDQIHLPENLDIIELIKKIDALKAQESEGKK